MDNQQGPNNNNGDKRNDKNGQMLLMLIVVTLVALFIMSLVTRLETSSMSKEISYTEFLNMINEDKVAAVEFASQQINITPKTEKGSISLTTYYTGYVNDSELLFIKGKGYRHPRDHTGQHVHLGIQYLKLCDTARARVDPARLFDEAHGRRRHDGCRKEQCQGLCGKEHRRYL